MTDDLVRRARAVASWVPTASAPAIIYELADEVDRLRGELRWPTHHALKERIYEVTYGSLTIEGLVDELSEVKAERDTARAALERGEASDGYHTHNELYEYRMLYNAHAAHGWLAASIPVVKSWKHSDGELAFGGGWFIVVATLPTGQVSNHYEAAHWDLFDVPEVDLPPEYDGHSPEDASNRLRNALEEDYRRQSE